MLSRIISGVVLAVGIVLVLLKSPWWGFGIVIGVAAALGSNEYIRMARPMSGAGERGIFIIISTLVACAPMITRFVPTLDHTTLLTIGFVVLMTVRLANPKPIEDALNRAALDVCGLMYLGVTFPLIFDLRAQTNDGWLVLLAMVITFASDTGGYFAGRFLGKNKLYPTVSPKKTIEGAIGGIIAAVGGTYLLSTNIDSLAILTPMHCVAIGGLGACMAIIGDLVESLMKRAFGVKDSGALIPGHGGILDRIDGLLFCGPFVWIYLRICFQ
ncbi:MAG: phosphatidate cytidylyltransferase [Myxococcota bacterium]|nr:phosphatidate cytidylyltransferase [Myxococcota bacterium]